jgi:hypothetical protein
VTDEPRNFLLALSPDQMEGFNLKGKSSAETALHRFKVFGGGSQEPVFCNASCAARASSPVRPACRAVCNLM